MSKRLDKTTIPMTAKLNANRLPLKDGIRIPIFGLGVYQLQDTSVVCKAALEHGYRLIDCAAFYGNEAEVGDAVRNSGIPRNEIIVTSKLWNDSHGYEECIQAFKDTLKKFNLDYIDLYLIHSPLGGKLVETYKALMHLKDNGLIKSVGVSNFDIHHLEGLRKAGQPTPSVNQIELHCFRQQKKLVKYCHDHGIIVMGYSPLAKMKKTEDTILEDIAKKHKKTFTDVMLRWSVQKGYITIPKTSNVERLIQNATALNWELDSEDMEKIEKVEEFHCTWDPQKEPWTG